MKKLKIKLDLENQGTVELCSMAKGIKTAGDSVIVAPPVSDADQAVDADAALVIHSQRQTNQSKTLTAQESQLTSKIKRNITRVAHYVEDTANEYAIQQGSYDAGKAVILRCGFVLEDDRDLHQRTLEEVASGPGWFHVRTKSVGEHATYIWRYGLTSSKGTPPTEFRPLLITTQCEFILIGGKSGGIYGVQCASILPIPRTKPGAPDVKKKSTIIPASKAGKPTFTDGAEPWQWSDWIYIVCK